MSHRTLYLHVGMDKTGTSAIQYFMYKNKEKIMRDCSLCYPTVGLWHDFSHHIFAFSVMEQHGYTINNLKELFAALVDEVGKYDSVLLSSECLFKVPLKERFTVFRELIASYFSQVKVIVYVRRQDEWVESRYKHAIFSGNDLSLEKLMTPFFCDYKQYIDKWANVFGLENITVKVYEKQQFTGGDIFTDFISIFGLRLMEGYEIPEKDLNISLGLVETEFKGLCNKIGFSSDSVDALNAILIEHSSSANSLKKARYFLSPLERYNLVSRYSNVNNAIAREYLSRKDGVLFYEDLPNPDQSSDKYIGLEEFDVANFGRIISQKNPDIFDELKDKIDAAIVSDDTDIIAAAKLLSKMYN